MLNLGELYVCPYCATYQPLQSYKLKFKNSRLTWITCPICKNKMRRGTLINDLSPYEWGEWIYLSIRAYRDIPVPGHKDESFFNKVKFPLLIENLNKMSMITRNDFWKGYKDAKAFYSMSRSILTQLEARMKLKEPSKIRLDKFISSGSEDKMVNDDE